MRAKKAVETSIEACEDIADYIEDRRVAEMSITPTPRKSVMLKLPPLPDPGSYVQQEQRSTIVLNIERIA